MRSRHLVVHRMKDNYKPNWTINQMTHTASNPHRGKFLRRFVDSCSDLQVSLEFYRISTKDGR